jgi:hypothetical protein
MRLGLQLPSFTFPGGAAAIRSTLTEIGQAAEEAEAGWPSAAAAQSIGGAGE